MPLSIAYKEWILSEFLASEFFSQKDFSCWKESLTIILNMLRSINRAQVSETPELCLFPMESFVAIDEPIKSQLESKLEILRDPLLMGISFEDLLEFYNLMQELITEELQRLNSSPIMPIIVRSTLCQQLKNLLTSNEDFTELFIFLAPLKSFVPELKQRHSCQQAVEELAIFFEKIDENITPLLFDQVQRKIKKIIETHRHYSLKKLLESQKNKSCSTYFLPWMQPLYQDLIRRQDEHQQFAFQLVVERIELCNSDPIESWVDSHDHPEHIDLTSFDRFLPVEESVARICTTSNSAERSDADNQLDSTEICSTSDIAETSDSDTQLDSTENPEDNGFAGNFFNLPTQSRIVSWDIQVQEEWPLALNLPQESRFEESQAEDLSRRFKEFLCLPRIRAALEQRTLSWTELPELDDQTVSLWFYIHNRDYLLPENVDYQLTFQKNILKLLYTLAKHERPQLMALLKEHVTLVTSAGQSLLQYYLDRHYSPTLTMVQTMIELGVDLRHIDFEKKNVLHDLALGSIDNTDLYEFLPSCLLLILEEDPQLITKKNNKGKTFVDYVLENDMSTCVQLLSPFYDWLGTIRGRSALSWALSYASLNVAEELVDAHLFHHSELISYIQTAANNSWMPIVMKLLPELEVKDIENIELEEGGTLLHVAVYYAECSIKMMTDLFRENIPLDAVDQNGKTFLHHLILQAFSEPSFLEEAVEILCQAVFQNKTVLLIKDHDEDSALDLIIKYDLSKMISPIRAFHNLKEIVCFETLCDSIAPNNDTSAQLIAYGAFPLEGKFKLLALVLKKQANLTLHKLLEFFSREELVNYRLPKGGTLLHFAIQQKENLLFRYLLDKGLCPFEPVLLSSALDGLNAARFLMKKVSVHPDSYSSLYECLQENLRLNHDFFKQSVIQQAIEDDELSWNECFNLPLALQQLWVSLINDGSFERQAHGLIYSLTVHQHLSLLKCLSQQQSINMNACDLHGRTVLHKVIGIVNHHTIKILLSIGLNPLLTNHQGYTALHQLLDNYYNNNQECQDLLEVIKTLLDHEPLLLEYEDEHSMSPIKMIFFFDSDHFIQVVLPYLHDKPDILIKKALRYQSSKCLSVLINEGCVTPGNESELLHALLSRKFSAPACVLLRRLEPKGALLLTDPEGSLLKLSAHYDDFVFFKTCIECIPELAERAIYTQEDLFDYFNFLKQQAYPVTQVLLLSSTESEQSSKKKKF